MRTYTIIFIFFLSHLNCLGDTILKTFEPLKYKENLKVSGFNIRDSYKLSETEFILIGRRNPEPTDDFGYRLIYLKSEEGRFKVKYQSSGAFESYIYKPTFFRRGTDVLIVCETGAEYSWGLNAFLVKSGSISEIGNMNVAAYYNSVNHPESAIPALQISERGDYLFFEFKKPQVLNKVPIRSLELVYAPGQEKEEILAIGALKYELKNDTDWKIIKQ